MRITESKLRRIIRQVIKESSAAERDAAYRVDRPDMTHDVPSPAHRAAGDRSVRLSELVQGLGINAGPIGEDPHDPYSGEDLYYVGNQVDLSEEEAMSELYKLLEDQPLGDFSAKEVIEHILYGEY
jgi:hypothetical protein